jgi:solute carrier family 8 (sodium/calcium exchanger)
MHAISLPWKLWAALIPPTDLGSGYPCFVTSLVFVGILTAWIGDLANLLGCVRAARAEPARAIRSQSERLPPRSGGLRTKRAPAPAPQVVGLKSSIVAFTFVALGTSLPDTFASRTAALGDDTADNAVGNVTGSNAVNVFLGLGLSWVVGSIYWYVNGADEAYIKRYPDIAEKYDIKVGDSVGLAVRATDTSLAFNITVFTAFATVAIGLLAWRRKQFGCELGGPFRWPTFGILVSFWLMYVLLSALVADGVFEAF